jgi:hypothetical protein
LRKRGKSARPVVLFVAPSNRSGNVRLAPGIRERPLMQALSLHAGRGSGPRSGRARGSERMPSSLRVIAAELGRAVPSRRNPI